MAIGWFGPRSRASDDSALIRMMETGIDRMPRILYCIDTTGPGGAETVFVDLAQHFGRTPYESTAIVRGPGWVKDQLERRGVETLEIDSKGSLNVQFLHALVREIRARRIDLVHAHLLGANVYCAMAGWLTGVPVISTFHGSVDINSRERLAAIKFALVRNLSTVVAVSEGLRAEVAERLGVPRDRIRLIANGIDCAQFGAAKPAGIRASHGIAGATPLIGSLGNIRPAKAYHVGLRAVRVLRDSGIDVHWVIAGQSRPNDPLMSELEALTDELGLTEHVHFLGFVEHPERFIAELDVFLLCSESEGHPLALTQAMAAGKPIVATRCGVEKIVDAEMAWLSNVNDPEALAFALHAAITDPVDRERRRHRAQVHARSHFDNTAVFHNYERLYAEMLNAQSIRTSSA
jgi:glycosyltransferase involved in cell wall biosynthesis